MGDITQHSILAPSSRSRAVQCPWSVMAEQQFPETEEGESSAEGVAAHWVLAERLTGVTHTVGEIAPNSVVVSEAMVEGAQDAYDDIALTLAPYGLHPSQGRIEQAVAISRVHPQCWGTPDYAFVVALANGQYLVIVYDYKFGHGIVEVFENDQLIDYGIGVADLYQLPEAQTTFLFKIVQPRAYHRHGPIRDWKVRAVDLRALVNIHSNAAHEALGPNPLARTGAECKHCRARHACPTLQRSAYNAVDIARGTSPLEMDLVSLGLELRTLKFAQKLLNARVSGLEQQAIGRFVNGERVPGFDLERSAGRLVWNRPPAEVRAVADAMRVDVVKSVDLLTPKQAIAKGLGPALVRAMAEQRQGEKKLVIDDNSNTRKVFGRTA
jgi:hypothetical protein